MNHSRVAGIARDIYWVGGAKQDGGLHCNPYLLVDGEEAVLIDPGSVLDFDDIYENLCSIVPLEQIKYCILHHQDPDFCSAVPLLEKKGARFQIVTHWRTQTLVKYYGITSPYYIVNENDYCLTLESGRKLTFVPTPYLHFPGSIATYDSLTQTLFSSDLFGAFSYEWNLYAGDDYIDKMHAFHEHYMPSNDILRPVMEIFLGMDIALIAPQHGSIIKDDVPKHIRALRDLECGALMAPVRKDLAKSGGYRSICSTILKRYTSIFNRDEVLDVVGDLNLDLDESSMEIADYDYTGHGLWNKLFENVLAKKGLPWLLVIEPLVDRLAREYDIAVPDVFISALARAESETICLTSENTALKAINEKLQNSMQEAQERLIKCPVTGLYNYDFFRGYLAAELKDLMAEQAVQNPALLIINTDNITRIRFAYGDSEVDGVMKNIVYIINGIKDENTVLFKLQGAAFAAYLPHSSLQSAVDFAEKIRNAVASSGKFIEPITVSIGVASLEEIKTRDAFINDPAEAIFALTMMRARLAYKMGQNMVCHTSEDILQEENGRILIVDTDAVNIDVLKVFLENLKYRVLVAQDGEEALNAGENQVPNLIISEVQMPKMDGFQVRERLLMNSQTKNIPFIFISHLKNDDTVQRAAALGVEHYFRKPYMLSELLGVIRNKVKGDADHELE